MLILLNGGCCMEEELDFEEEYPDDEDKEYLKDLGYLSESYEE